MLDVVAAMPFKSELIFEKKSRLVPANSPLLAWTREVLLIESLLDSGDLVYDSPCIKCGLNRSFSI